MQSVDSAYSWVVASASFFVYLILYGVYRLSGVMFIASMPRFRVGREAASFPYTFAGFTKNIAGPVVGFLLNKFSIRTLIVSGCILASVGVGTCFFAENIFTVTILWGLVYGFGFALSCSLLPVLINDHFLKHRATASGIAFSGMCVGSMVFPPLVEVCIDFYGISGTFLIISGLVFNCVPIALFLRSRSIYNAAEVEVETQNDLKQRGVSIVTENTAFLTPKSHLHKNVLFYASISERRDILKTEDSLENHQLLNNQTHDENSTKYMQTNYYQYVNTPNNPEGDYKTNIHCGKNKDDIPQTKYYEEVSSEKASDNSPINPKVTYDEIETHNIPSPAKTTQFKSNSRTSQSLCRGNCTLIINPIYLIVVITKSLTNTTTLCLNTVIFDYSRDIGIGTEYEKYILIFSSLGELLGRLCLGRIADTHCLSKAMFMVLCSFAQALGALGIGWSNGFYILVAGLFFYSFMGSVAQFMCPLIIADGIEIEKQAFAIASSSVLAGPASLAISPLIGYLRDEIGSYAYLFYGFGVLSVLTGIMWMLGYFFINLKKLSVIPTDNLFR